MMNCGHDESELVGSAEGTWYCGGCERDARARGGVSEAGSSAADDGADGDRSSLPVGERQGRQPASLTDLKRVYDSAVFTLRFSAERGVWNPIKPAEAEVILRTLDLADADRVVVGAAKVWAEARRRFLAQEYDAQLDEAFKFTEQALLAAIDALPYVTPDGRVLTDEEIEALADEAERGYEVEDFKARAAPGDSGEERPKPVTPRRPAGQGASTPESPDAAPSVFGRLPGVPDSAVEPGDFV